MKLRSHLAMISPYKPVAPLDVLSARMGRVPEAIIKLDANENPYGPSPRVCEALARLEYPHIYPDPESRSLRAALAAFTGVPEEYLLAGAGVDELIDLLVRALIDPGEKVLICPPTFEMYATHTRLNAGQIVEAPRREDFSLDLEAIRQTVATHHPKAFFLPTPSNPDGSLPSPAEIDALLELPTLVILDEAYIEFSGQGWLGQGSTHIQQAPKRDNLIVLRTFSKWAGLAGLRVGYGAFPQWLMPALWKAKQPYNVSVAASVAAIASLEDADSLAGIVEHLRREQERLFAGLCAVPYLRPYPTKSNFILCRIAGGWGDENTPPGQALKDYLFGQGILIRYFESPRLRDHVRISVGTPEHTAKLLETLQRKQTDRET